MDEMNDMELSQLLRHVDHTLLRPDAGWQEIRFLCDEALAYHTASVCVPPSYVAQCAGYLAGRVAVCTVIGFPNGYSTTAVKAFEAADAVQNGADEIDMVINLGWVKDGRWTELEEDIRRVKEACQGRILKVIVEACLLTEAEKIQLCRIVTAAGADYIKTSTGFSTGGATREDVALFARHVGPGVKIKAAGSIATLRDGADFLALGADRLGTSRIVRLVKARQGTQ